MGTIGSWGLHTQVQPRFGARAIVERSRVSLLWIAAASMAMLTSNGSPTLIPLYRVLLSALASSFNKENY